MSVPRCGRARPAGKPAPSPNQCPKVNEHRPFRIQRVTRLRSHLVRAPAKSEKFKGVAQKCEDSSVGLHDARNGTYGTINDHGPGHFSRPDSACGVGAWARSTRCGFVPDTDVSFRRFAPASPPAHRRTCPVRAVPYGSDLTTDPEPDSDSGRPTLSKSHTRPGVECMQIPCRGLSK